MIKTDKENTQNNKAWWIPAIALFLRMSVWIIVPVMIAVIIGKWFDNEYNTEPWGLLGIIGLSFIFSIFMIVKIVLDEYKNIEKEEENKK
jgi:F0F1-type ATP synthase assembly protein I